jgi:hypothetical protein
MKKEKYPNDWLLFRILFVVLNCKDKDKGRPCIKGDSMGVGDVGDCSSFFSFFFFFFFSFVKNSFAKGGETGGVEMGELNVGDVEDFWIFFSLLRIIDVRLRFDVTMKKKMRE